MTPDTTTLSRGEGLTAWRQIADALEAELADPHRTPPGARLPGEAALAARFGAHRHTVRRALADLAARGLVRAAQGRGTFAAEEPPPLRYPIGPRTRFSEAATAAGREASGRLLGHAEVAAEGWAAEALGLAPGAPVLELRTLRAADGVPISLARTLLPLPRFAGFERAFGEAGSVTRAFAAHGVADYARVSTRVTARLATAAEAAALDLGPGPRPVLAVQGVNADPAGVAVQATRAVFAAERVELAVDGGGQVKAATARRVPKAAR